MTSSNILRWEAYLFRSHGGIPSGPCDLEVLIFESWSSTPLSEMVSLAIFPCGVSFRFGYLECPSSVKTLLN